MTNNFPILKKSALIFTDLDGTFLNNNNFSFGKNLDIAKEITELGHFIIFNSSKTFAEIGTRNGDVSKCVAQFTKRAFAVEMEESYCRRLVQRGIEVECMRFEKVPDQRLVGVDVFFWFVWPPELSEGWLRRLWTLPRADNASATVLVAFDGHIPEDMRFLPLFVAHYGGSVERIFLTRTSAE